MIINSLKKWWKSKFPLYYAQKEFFKAWAHWDEHPLSNSAKVRYRIARTAYSLEWERQEKEEKTSVIGFITTKSYALPLIFSIFVLLVFITIGILS